MKYLTTITIDFLELDEASKVANYLLMQGINYSIDQKEINE